MTTTIKTAPTAEQLIKINNFVMSKEEQRLEASMKAIVQRNEACGHSHVNETRRKKVTR